MLGLLVSTLLLSKAWAAPTEPALNELAKRRIPPKNFPIQRVHAFGDSYTTNPGAGHKVNDKCQIFSQNWPVQTTTSDSLNVEGFGPGFSMYACAGAKTHAVKAQAQSQGEHTPELSLITIGGNDLGFSGILRACVYGASLNPDAECGSKLAGANQVLNGPLKDNLRAAYNAIFTEKENTNLFVLGYPRFFVEDTPQCGQICFGSVCNEDLKITNMKRQRFNNIVLNLNQVIKAAIDAMPGSDRIAYVDTDDAFDGHRFCQRGVDEPAKQREDTWFYHLTRDKPNFKKRDTDVQGDDFNPADCDADQDVNDTMSFDISALCFMHNNPNWMQANFNTTDVNQAIADKKVPKKSDFLRTFHPTINGAGAYASSFLKFYKGN